MLLTGGEIVAEHLVRRGVPYLAGIPGHGCLGLLDAFQSRHRQIGIIQVRHEQSAVHLADGFYRVSGKPLAVFTSIGPGASNTVVGLATAYVDSTAAQRSGKLFRVCENFRYYPPYVRARELIDEGAIGEPLSIRVKVLGGSPQGGWRVPAEAWRWRLTQGECGGGPMIFDHGYHIFSIVLYFLGAVEKVFAWIEQVEVGPGLILDSPAMITWKHREGSRYGSWESVVSPELMIRSKYYANEEFIDITGSKGIIWLNRCSGMMLEEPALVLYRDGETRALHTLETDWASSFVRAGQDFIAAVREGRQCSLSGSEAREVLQFSLAAHRSARERQEVRVEEMVN